MYCSQKKQTKTNQTKKKKEPSFQTCVINSPVCFSNAYRITMMNYRKKTYIIAGDKVSAYKSPCGNSKPRGEEVVFDNSNF